MGKMSENKNFTVSEKENIFQEEERHPTVLNWNREASLAAFTIIK
jgi:hypothetical protein